VTKLPDVAPASSGNGNGGLPPLHSAMNHIRRLRDDLRAIGEAGTGLGSERDSAEEREAQIQRDIDSTESDVEGIGRAIAELEAELMELSQRLEVARETHIGHSDALRELNAAMSRQTAIIEEKSGDLDRVRSEFEAKKKEVSKFRLELVRLLAKDRKKRFAGPENKAMHIASDTEFQADGLISLGDVHGWAPGLFNYLIGNQLADVSLCGFLWSQIKHSKHFKWRGSTTDFTSPPGLDGHPSRPNSPPTVFSRLEVVPADTTRNRRLIMVGDLIDRGDHSELVVEAVRQMVASVPGCCFSLIGNHEAMVILDLFEIWASNEEVYLNDKSLPGRPFTVSHDPIVTGETTLEGSMEMNFRALRGSIGALLLTQHFSLLRS
ncbi:uncharacterized protein METZ01_LOCUS245840, partial [marine metagenome]